MAEGSSARSIEPAVPSKACMVLSAHSSYLHTSSGAAVRGLPLASQPCPCFKQPSGTLPVWGACSLLPACTIRQQQFCSQHAPHESDDLAGCTG